MHINLGFALYCYKVLQNERPRSGHVRALVKQFTVAFCVVETS